MRILWFLDVNKDPTWKVLSYENSVLDATCGWCIKILIYSSVNSGGGKCKLIIQFLKDKFSLNLIL